MSTGTISRRRKLRGVLRDKVQKGNVFIVGLGVLSFPSDIASPYRNEPSSICSSLTLLLVPLAHLYPDSISGYYQSP
jgi:hypothetical protein